MSEKSTPVPRGPRGVPETARITVFTTDNPKRKGTMSHRMWEVYRQGMTVGEFCDAMDAVTFTNGKSGINRGTPALVYDAAHGFISIEGYEPGEVKKATPKPKAPKAKESKGTAAAAPVATEVME